MNPPGPQTPQPSRPIQDVGPPHPNASDDTTLTTNLVQDIPMQTQSGPAHEDADLDRIMQDVGQDLKKVDERPKKRGLFSKKPKPASHNPAPTPAPAHQPAAQTQLPQAAPAAHPAPTPVPKAGPAPKNSAPVFVIFMTIIVTAGLIAAAVYASK